jgi:hypothetical protein
MSPMSLEAKEAEPASEVVAAIRSVLEAMPLCSR